MGIIHNFRKKLAIKLYMKRLPSLLAMEYGLSKSYKPEQVDETIKQNKLSLAFNCYAMAMFSSKYAFNRYHSKNRERYDYEALKEAATSICSDVAPDRIPNSFISKNTSAGGYGPQSCGPSECDESGDGGGD